MSLDERYVRYLQHFGETCTVSELARDTERAGVALRHDVDHDLGLALDMGLWEREHGRRATYYLLHTAPYWDDPKLLDACLQLQDYGHEVGLHLNVLSQWWAGSVADPGAHLSDLLATLRTGGVNVVGSSAHGDRLCYEAGFINYWLLAELRGDDPIAREAGLSAEGVPDPSTSFVVQYPATGELIRPDGERLRLWSTSMAELGLEHEAVRVPVDGYFTDSGGGWTRSPDPLRSDLSSGRHQVLIHPEYWRGPQRMIFFLSTARSGSKWLATMLDEGTSATVRHEFSLNHRYRDELVEEKRTGVGARDLLRDGPTVRRLLAEVRAWVESLDTDYFEANVYLPHVIEQLREVYPEGLLVHLHRDPYDVVRSLLNREWYDTPEDDRHPRIAVPGWDEMSQLEQCAWYVRDTSERLRHLAAHSLRLEDIASGPRILQERLALLGVAFHPRLVVNFGEPVNVARGSYVDAVAAWGRDERRTLNAVVEHERQTLGYARLGLRGRLRRLHSRADRPRGMSREAPRIVRTVIADVDASELISTLATTGCSATLSAGSVRVQPDGDRHANVRLGGGAWRRLERGQGWRTSIGDHVRGSIEGAVVDGPPARVICLMYDADGKLLDKRDVATVGDDATTFSFRPRPDAEGWDLAIYAPVGGQPREIVLRRVHLESIRRHP